MREDRKFYRKHVKLTIHF